MFIGDVTFLFQMKTKKKQLKKEGKSTVVPEDDPEKVCRRTNKTLLNFILIF